MADKALKIEGLNQVISELRLLNKGQAMEAKRLADTAADAEENRREKDKPTGASSTNSVKPVADVAETAQKETKGFFSKLLGGMAGGVGLGGGALMAGAGLLAGGGALLLKQLGELDGKSIRANVNELLGIADDHGSGTFDFLLKGGTFGLAMAGIGAGIAAFSVGAGVAAAITKFSDKVDWADSIKSNVTTLLSISDELGGNVSLLADGTTFGVSMAAIGAGLLAFSVGSIAGTAAAGMDTALKKFTDGTSFSDNVKYNVKTLLSIKKELGGNFSMLGDAAGFLPAMAAIGAGLLAFSVGSIAGTAAAGMDETLKAFSDGTSFADNIKYNVTTLLSIKDEMGGNFSMLGDAAGFLPAMAAIGAGLLAFSVGSVAATAASGMDEAVKAFGVKGYADNIKDNVITLLSIKDSMGGNLDLLKESGAFFLAMTGIGAGLLAFSGGAAAATAASGMDEAMKSFTTVGFAQGIKDNVTTLLSITGDEGVSLGDATDFVATMGIISAGIIAFAGAGIVDALAGVASGVLNFFTGNDSPMEKIKTVADNADNLEKGAGALERIGSAISNLNTIQFKANKFQFSEFAADLVNGVEGINVAMYGGTFDTSKGALAFGGKIKVGKGLADMPQLDFENASTGISLLHHALGNYNGNPVIGNQQTADQAAAAGNPVVINSQDQSITNNVTYSPEQVVFQGKPGGGIAGGNKY